MNAMQWLGSDNVLRFVLTLVVQVSAVLVATLSVSWLFRRRTAVRHAVCLCGLCAALACPLTSVAARQAGMVWIAMPWPAADGPVPATVAAELPSAPVVESELSGSGDAGGNVPETSTSSPARDASAVAVELDYRPADSANQPIERTADQELTVPDPRSTQTSTTAANVAIPPGELATSLVVMAWFIGVAYLLFRWVRTATQMRRIVRDASPIDRFVPASGGRQPAEWAGITSFAPLFPQFSLTQVAASRSLPVPIVYGVFRPRIIIPESLLRPGAEEMLQDVLLHELSHVRRRDPFVNLLQRLATMLYWPHPLVYLVDRQLSATREDLCDNHVLQHRRPADYARTLLELSEGITPTRCPQAALAMMPEWSSLEQRVAALLDPRRSTRVRNARWLNGLVAAAAACVGVAVAGIHPGDEPTASTALAQADDSDATATADEAGPSQRLIVGTVVEENGGPVANASVRYASPSLAGTAVRTNAAGRFELLIPPRIQRYRWILLARDTTGDMLGHIDLPDEDGELELKGEIALSQARRTTATVRDVAGQPVPGAIVTVIGGDNFVAVGEAVTDDSGTAIVRYPSQVGIVWLVARKDGVGFDYFENYSATRQQIYGALPQAVGLKLDGARTVTVRVLDSSGRPISNSYAYPITITRPGKLNYANLSGAIAVPTDDAGEARLAWLPARFEEAIAVYAHHPEYTCSDPDVLRAGDGTTELEPRMRKLSAISGRVTDLDARPAPGIRVIAYGVGEGNNGGSASARTARDGTFRMDVEREAAYLLSVSDPDFAAASWSTGLIGEGESIADVHLTLFRGTLVTGLITAGSKHAPVRGASISLQLRGDQLPNIVGRPVLTRRLTFLTKSDDSGRYAVRLAHGHYQMQIYSGRQGVPHDLEILENDSRETIVIDQHFETPADVPLPLRGRVIRAADGAPLSNATVFLGVVGAEDFMTFVQAVADEDGRFSVDRDGERHLVYGLSVDRSLAGFSIVDSDVSEITLELAPSATAVGQLLDHNGEPLAYAEVAGEIRAPNIVSRTARLTTRTDAQGRYRIPGIAVGARFFLLPQRTNFGRNPTTEVKQSGDFEVETVKLPQARNPDHPERIAATFERLVTEIEASTDPSERRALLHRALSWAEDLLVDKDRDPVVHENAVLLLTDLNSRSADPDRKTPPIPFTAAHKPLLRVLSDSKFAADTRAAAAEGLTRILNDADDTVDGGGLSAEARQQVQSALAAAEKESIRPSTAPATERRKPD